MPQPTLEPLRRWDPERIGPYVLLGRLGAGAMGRVYLGRSTAGRLVAVKTIKIELADEAGFRARFAHEVAAARRVSGVFTAAVVAADPEADMPWLATAYVPAPSLSQLVAECGPLPVPAARWLAAGCAEALESIHSAGLVHRDLKPSNVLVSPDGPRVIDFGVARAAERIQLTVTRGAVGTPAYMAPEQARDTRQATLASDVFSLGATLAFAATGHAPYRGETVMDVLVRLATEPPDLSGLPAELDGIVTACLARSPAPAAHVGRAARPARALRRRPGRAALGGRLPARPGDGRDQRIPARPPAGRTAPAARPAATAARTPDGSTGDGAAGEDTSGSTGAASPATPPSARRRRCRHRPPPCARSAAAPGGWGARTRPGTARATAPRRAGDRRGHRALIAAGLAGAAVALVAGGVIVGASLANRHGHAPGPARPRPRAFPPPGPPPSAFPTAPSGSPQIRMLQPIGDPDTVFLIHGTGWVPRSRVTVTLAGHGESPIRPVVDMKGTFNYAVNQGHEFFPRRLPPGVYHVVVTGPGGRRARARFQVHRAAARPGPAHRSGRWRGQGPGSTTGPPAGSTRPDRSAGPGQRR